VKERNSISNVDSIGSDDDGNSNDYEIQCEEAENLNSLSKNTYEVHTIQIHPLQYYNRFVGPYQKTALYKKKNLSDDYLNPHLKY